jgi:hypothetical protein
VGSGSPVSLLVVGFGFWDPPTHYFSYCGICISCREHSEACRRARCQGAVGRQLGGRAAGGLIECALDLVAVLWPASIALTPWRDIFRLPIRPELLT